MTPHNLVHPLTVLGLLEISFPTYCIIYLEYLTETIDISQDLDMADYPLLSVLRNRLVYDQVLHNS